MDAQFWHQCWQQNQLGFQLDEAHPFLRAQTAALPPATDVFVPLCGKSPDLHWLAQHYRVTGAELSGIACRDFFAEAALQPLVYDCGDFQLWQSENYQLWQGDFFALPVSAVGACQLIYDRAALIALPPAMQRQYVTKLRQLFPSSSLLLISLHYPPGEKQGPPFSIDEAELNQLFNFASLHLLGIRNLTGQGFARRKFATSQLIEKCWLIQW